MSTTITLDEYRELKNELELDLEELIKARLQQFVDVTGANIRQIDLYDNKLYRIDDSMGGIPVLNVTVETNV